MCGRFTVKATRAELVALYRLTSWLSVEAGAEYLKAAPNGYLKRWPVSKRVNSSKASADDSSLIEEAAI
jgi:putative SOS response-associated peptidase YedK